MPLQRDISHWADWPDGDLIDQAAGACQSRLLLENEMIREAIALNIIAPLRQRIAQPFPPKLQRRNPTMTDKLVERALLRFVADCSDEEQMLPAVQFIANRSDLIADAITKALASSSVPEQDGWQPIETAPKDGSKIDLWADRRMTDCFWRDGVWIRYSHSKSGVARYVSYLDFNPTHWMPKPPPPAPQDRGASQEDGRA